METKEYKNEINEIQNIQEINESHDENESKVENNQNNNNNNSKEKNEDIKEEIKEEKNEDIKEEIKLEKKEEKKEEKNDDIKEEIKEEKKEDNKEEKNDDIKEDIKEEKKEEIKEEKKEDIKEEKKEEIKEEKKEDIKEEKNEEIKEEKKEDIKEEKKENIKSLNIKAPKVSMFDILKNESSFPKFEKNDYEKCINCFSDFFISNITNIERIKEIIKEKCLNNKTEENLIRSTIWKLLLENTLNSNYISLENLISKTKNLRNEYHKKLEYLNQLKKLPLTSIQWLNYLSDLESIRIINLDIDRTFPTTKLFSNKKIKNIENSILLIWSSENKDIGYHQGMNEILAMIIYSLYPFYFKNNTKNFFDNLNYEKLNNDLIKIKKELYDFFHDEDELESDIYNLFNLIMNKGIKRLYNEKDINQNQNNEIQEYLFQRCNIIINKKLRLQNENLFKHFKTYGIDCEIFLQKWLKCLFDREFDYKITLRIWDVLIYDNEINEKKDFNLIDYICVSMIDNIKNELIKGEQAENLELLFNYPKVNSAYFIIENAINIRNFLIVKEKEDDILQDEMKKKRINLIKQIEDIDKTTSDNRIESSTKKTSLYDFFNDKKTSLQNFLRTKKNNNNTNNVNNNKKSNNNKINTKMFSDTPKKIQNPLFPEPFEDLPDEIQLYKNSLNLKERKLNDLKNILDKYKDKMNKDDYENSIEILEFLKKNL